MESSLSSVPPVWPSPRPEIIGTTPPQAATIGASISETLSPTPPVECLSSTGPLASGQESTSPESRMVSVRPTRSSIDMPRKKTAMAKAATCPSVTLPSVRPSMRKAISCARQRAAVALLADDLLREEGHSGPHSSNGRRATRSLLQSRRLGQETCPPAPRVEGHISPCRDGQARRMLRQRKPNITCG